MWSSGFFRSAAHKGGTGKTKARKVSVERSWGRGELKSSGSFPFDYAQGQDDSKNLQCKTTA